MKRIQYFFITLILLSAGLLQAQIAINKDGSTPASGTILHVKGSGGNSFVIDDATGYVGMNVMTPEMAIDIYDPNTAAFVKLKGTGNSFDYAGIQLWSEESPDKLWQIVHRKEAYMKNYFVIQWTDGFGNWPKRFVIDTDGKVGIGKDNPSEKLHVDGNVKANAFYTPAKIAGKSTGVPVRHSLDIVQEMKAFEVKTGDGGFALDVSSLENVLPQVVKNNDDGSRSVNYQGIVPVLVEAVKKQQAIIEEQGREIERLKRKIENGCMQ